jgi:hypothetical protein
MYFIHNYKKLINRFLPHRINLKTTLRRAGDVSLCVENENLSNLSQMGRH